MNKLKISLHTLLVGSCKCLTKSHVHTEHAENCHYRIVCEAIDKIEQLEKENAALEDGVKKANLARCDLEEKNREQQATIQLLAEALDAAADTLAWFKKHDFANTYRALAAKHLGGKNG